MERTPRHTCPKEGIQMNTTPKRPLAWALILTVVTALVAACAPQPGTLSSERPEGVLEVLEQHDDKVLSLDLSSEMTTSSVVEGQQAVEIPGSGVSVAPPVEDGDAVTSTGNTTIVHSTTDETSQVIVQDNAALQMLTVINNVNDPTEYGYDVDVPDGGNMQLAPDGGVVITDAGGIPVSAVTPPFAVDANNKPVDTRFRLEGDRLIQEVDHRVAGIAYPVLADPFWIPGWVLAACGIGFLSNGAGYWVEGGRRVWTFIKTGAVGCVFGIIGGRALR